MLVAWEVEVCDGGITTHTSGTAARPVLIVL
jgi:hypothetical protein